jgi:ATP-dependent Lon protease
MTGEITLRGRVLPIGGLKEKCVAAVRSGKQLVIIPHGNAREVEELPVEVREALTIRPVKSMDEVLELALAGRIAARVRAGDAPPQPAVSP